MSDRYAPDFSGDRFLVFSADGHAGALDVEQYRPYLEPQYWPALEDLAQERPFWSEYGVAMGRSPSNYEVIDTRGAMASGGLDGGWDIERRLAELDAEGIAGELIFPKWQFAPTPFFGITNRAADAALRDAGARAHHRWLAGFMSRGAGRLVGVGDPGSCADLETTLKELRWIADHGFVSVSVPGIVADQTLPPIYDEYYDPFWRECESLGLVLSVHAGHGEVQGEFYRRVQGLIGGARRHEDLVEFLFSRSETAFNPRRVLWQLMVAGVFDRHPNLRLVMTEVRADWIPATLDHLDSRFERGDLSLMHARPSEHWERACAAGVSFIHRAEVEAYERIGVRKIMFGADFPHPESTWPNTAEWIRDAFAGVPFEDAALMLGGNAIDFYGLDRDTLQAVANRVGPHVSDVLDGTREPVDERLIRHFDRRGGYLRPTEVVDTEAIDGLLDEDLARIVNRRLTGSLSHRTHRS